MTVILLRGELHRREGKLTDALADHALGIEKTKALEPSRRIEPLLALAETQLAGERWADAVANARAVSRRPCAKPPRRTHATQTC